jgi:hypothetical protein
MNGTIDGTVIILLPPPPKFPDTILLLFTVPSYPLPYLKQVKQGVNGTDSKWFTEQV